MKAKKRDVTKKEFYIYCPICQKEINGTTSEQVEYNMKLHLDKHKRKNVGENKDSK